MPRVLVDRDVSVEMRDGVELSADIYRPASEEPLPTLIHRIPYDKSFAWYVGSLMINPFTAVQRGYVVVVQDTRGRFTAEGNWQPFHHEAEDGYDTIEWAAGRPWSNGSVGIYGSSYMGVTTLQATIANPPHLETAVAYLTGANYHNGWTYTGGAYELGFNLHWILGLGWDTINRLSEAAEARAHLAEAYEHPMDAAEYLPVKDLPGTEAFAPYWHDWLNHPEYDEYWESIDITANADNIEIPILHVTGWFDLFLRGHLDLYSTVMDRAENTAKDNHRFIIGPWDHNAYLTGTPSEVGDWRFGADVAGGVSFMSERTLSWFDHWLKDDPVEYPTNGVRYFDLGRQSWEESPTWPPDHTTTHYYLHSNGNAEMRTGDGTLEEEPRNGSPDSFIYDPANPVPTYGGRAYMPELAPGGIQDRSKIQDRDDVLVYTSPNLTTPLSIAGPVTVILYVSSSAPDTDFTAVLGDVHPDGYCASIADGIQRTKYRNSRRTPEFMEPNHVYKIEIDLWAVAHTFDEGNQIRVEISSSNFPRFDRNPNTVVTIADAGPADYQPATQVVYHDPETPSHIQLPVIK